MILLKRELNVTERLILMVFVLITTLIANDILKDNFFGVRRPSDEFLISFVILQIGIIFLIGMLTFSTVSRFLEGLMFPIVSALSIFFTISVLYMRYGPRRNTVISSSFLDTFDNFVGEWKFPKYFFVNKKEDFYTITLSTLFYLFLCGYIKYLTFYFF